MKILVVDNDSAALQAMSQALKEVFQSDEIALFLNPLAAIKHLSEAPLKTALVFAPLLLHPMHSLQLAECVRWYAPGVTVIFFAQTESAELWALVKQVCGADCITAPVTAEALRAATNFLFEPCQWEDCEGCVCDWCEDRISVKRKA